MTSAPKSDRTVAAPGPAKKLARSTTFRPEKILSVVIVLLQTLLLTPLELWNSFFEKRGRAFLLVFCRRANRDERRFKEKAFGQAGLQSFVDSLERELD